MTTADEAANLLTHTCRHHPGLRFMQHNCESRKKIASRDPFKGRPHLFEVSDIWLCETCPGPIPVGQHEGEKSNDPPTNQVTPRRLPVQDMWDPMEPTDVLPEPSGSLPDLLGPGGERAETFGIENMEGVDVPRAAIDIMKVYEECGPFGMLTPIKCLGNDRLRNKIWLCQCECGAICTPTSANLMAGNSRSCGCQQRKNGKKGRNRK